MTRYLNKRGVKRRFDEIRHLILSILTDGQKTINDISNKTDVNWKTVENHLTWLTGRGLVKEVVSLSYVRIFEITNSGYEILSNYNEYHSNGNGNGNGFKWRITR
jgi:predicted transcriptional regulator